MKSLLLIAITAAILFLANSFSDKECEHIYCAVQQPEVKQVAHLTPSAMFLIGQTAGQELVCVKCFNKIKQVFKPFDGVIRGTYPDGVEWNFLLPNHVGAGNDTLYFRMDSLSLDGTILWLNSDSVVEKIIPNQYYNGTKWVPIQPNK